MSTKAANGSGSSSRSKKSSGTKHSSNPKSTSSKTPSRSKSVSSSYDTADSAKSSNSTRHHSSHSPSECLVYYLNDTEHSNTGHRSSYTNALTYTYGFPDEQEARREMEQEMMTESKARALEHIDEYDRQMGYEQRQD